MAIDFVVLSKDKVATNDTSDERMEMLFLSFHSLKHYHHRLVQENKLGKVFAMHIGSFQNSSELFQCTENTKQRNI